MNETIESRVVNALKDVAGVEAISLGGSRAGGYHTEQSDYDIALYFRGELDLPSLAQRLQELDDQHRSDLLNPPGAWGKWICGGGWLTIEGKPVDILLRDLDQVARVLTDCVAGKMEIDYQVGHPHGFVNAIYAGETYYSKTLWQKNDALDRLKAMVATYPPAMRDGIVAQFLWEAEFSMLCGRAAIKKGDLLYAAGSIYRSIACLLQVIFAWNNVYLMNEKGALRRAEGLGLLPEGFKQGADETFANLGQGDLEQAFERLLELNLAVKRLVPTSTGVTIR